MSNSPKLNPSDPPQWNELFPVETPAPPEGVFELGLVLRGTVSAGAYTAGVVDFLVEALDAWEAEKVKNPGAPSVPDWQTRLKVVAGTSGGGVIAAILGRALSFAFPPIRQSTNPIHWRSNLFYRIWVNELDIRGMLGLDDLVSGQKVKSVLNAGVLERCAELIVRYPESFPEVSPRVRDYVDESYPTFLTLTNIRGMPYLINMGEGLKQSYLDHADHVRLAVFSKPGNSPLRPDEFGLSSNPGTSGFISWADAAQFALGTAAFPIGFPMRELSRPLAHYRYRPLVIPGEQRIFRAEPDWSALSSDGQTDLPETYYFVAADGGMMNNEPIELCRRTLAGMIARNPRDGVLSKRAVLLVDPFAEAPSLGPEKWSAGFLGELGPLVMSWKDQARYDSRDLMLAADSNCFSRFMITPRRQGVALGGKAIASASASAFGGFLNESFRRHDFLLGRANCQAYLRNELDLPVSGDRNRARRPARQGHRMVEKEPYRMGADLEELYKFTPMAGLNNFNLFPLDIRLPHFRSFQ